MLGPDRLIEVVDRLSATFDLTGIAEHAIELDPRRVTPQLAARSAASASRARASAHRTFHRTCNRRSAASSR
jgi:hypothetical protein